MSAPATTSKICSGFWTPSNIEKGLSDLHLIMDVVLAILICMGEAKLYTQITTAACVVAFSGTKLILGFAEFKMQKEKQYLIAITRSIAMLANLILGSCVLTGTINWNIYSIAALGIDLGALLLHRCSKRISGGENARYSCPPPPETEKKEPKDSLKSD